MQSPTPLLSCRRAGLFLTIVILVAAIYMVTYSGRHQTGDELYLFDGVGSLIDFNDLLLDISAGTRPPQTFETESRYPLPPVDAEPLQMLAAAPLYWIAEHVPGIGLIHTTWLMNVLV